MARQEADCRALCDREGWDVAAVLVDNDRSAYRGKRRAGYERLVEGLKAGEWDVVVAWHPDRLTRHPKELEALIDTLEAASVPVRTVTAGEYDLSTASGRMTARIVGAVARHESEHKAERQRRKHRELAEAGRDAGGGRPFGYLADRLTLHPAEAALVREAAGRILDGESVYAVCTDWAARGIPTVTGAGWTQHVLRRLLTMPRAAGYREHGGKLYRACWEPLLDEVTWRRLRALLLDPDRRTNLSARSYLLTGGLARCGLCGAKLVARPRDGGVRAYVCATGPQFDGCGKIGVRAEPFERDVADRVLSRIAAGRIPVHDVAEVGPLLAEIQQCEASEAELADDYYARRGVSRAQFQSASATWPPSWTPSAARSAVSSATAQRRDWTCPSPRAGRGAPSPSSGPCSPPWWSGSWWDRRSVVSTAMTSGGCASAGGRSTIGQWSSVRPMTRSERVGGTWVGLRVGVLAARFVVTPCG